jgi:nucleoside-diphosphate-sugar epimerase
MKKVLLTGASGFIGRNTILGLLARDYEVHAISSHPLTDLPGLFSYSCNLLNPAQTSKLVNQVAPTHLLHFAWYTEPCKYWTSDLNIEWTKASLHLLKEFIDRGGQRVVMSGSCAEYDWTYDMCHERETPLNPSTLYGECKASLSRIVEAYTKQMGCSSAWGRIFLLYGPHEYSQRLVPSVVQRLLKGEIAECSHGKQIRDLLHVEDVADAFVSLLNSDITGPVNIASGQAVSLKEVINKIARKLEAEQGVRFEAIPAAKNDAPKVVADVKRLSEELKWQPRYSLDKGLDQTIEWWKTALAPQPAKK